MTRWIVILLALAACDNKHDTAPATSATVVTTSAPVPEVSATPSASVASGPRAERPVPKEQHMVSSSAPIEQQQKAIAYMVAMRAPRAEDPNADPDYAKDLAEKLKPINLSLDNGPNKPKLNRVDVVANGREIDLMMSAGCDERTPNKAVVQRLSTPWNLLVLHGVFVVKCADSKIQCLQSTRDPDDILCTTNIRH